MFLYTCVKYEGLKLTNAISNNFGSLTNVNSTSSISEQIASSTAIDNFGMAKIASDEFSSSISNTSQAISDIDSEINATQDENKKQELKNQKEELVARKKDLEKKNAELKDRMAQLKSEIESHRSSTEATRSEISKLNANKASLEKTIQKENKEIAAKNDTLTGVNNKINSSKAELDDTIESLNKTVSDMTEKAEDDLKSQRKAISAATTEALELVKNGELKAEEMPSYIAGRISDYNSLGSTNAGTVIVDSQNTKIKGLCSQISSYVSQQGHVQLSIKASSSKLQLVSPLIESLNSKIQGKNAELKSSESVLSDKEAELNFSNAQYVNNELEITNVDSQIATINTQITETEVQQGQQEAPAQKGNQVKYPQFFLSNQGSSIVDINIDEEIGKIDAKAKEIMTEEVKNSEVDGLRAKMSEADKLIITLRNHLADNAQKIINERLDATRRR